MRNHDLPSRHELIAETAYPYASSVIFQAVLTEITKLRAEEAANPVDEAIDAVLSRSEILELLANPAAQRRILVVLTEGYRR